MANAVRGETVLSAGGQDYLLRLNTNALCELEAATGQKIGSYLASVSDNGLGVGDMRQILLAALRENYPDITLARVAEIMDAATLPAVAEVIAHAIKAAFPAAEAGSVEGNPL